MATESAQIIWGLLSFMKGLKLWYIYQLLKNAVFRSALLLQFVSSSGSSFRQFSISSGNLETTWSSLIQTFKYLLQDEFRSRHKNVKYKFRASCINHLRTGGKERGKELSVFLIKSKDKYLSNHYGPFQKFSFSGC